MTTEPCPNLRELGRQLIAVHGRLGGGIRISPDDLPGGRALVLRAFQDIGGETPSAQAESEALTAAVFLAGLTRAISASAN